MNAISQVVEDLLQKNAPKSTDSHSDSNGRNCEICGRFIPVMQLEILGRLRVVQPCCKCEADQHTKAIEEAEERLKQDRISQLFPLARMGSRFESCTLDMFKSRVGSEKVLELSKRYISGFVKWGETSLYIWGKPGNGKSHLAAAISHEIMNQNNTVVFQSVPELLGRIRNTFNSQSRETESQIMSALMKCHLLVMDDIGSEKVTDWVSEVLFKIIDGRYQAKKPILFTSNLKITELADRFENVQGTRIADRILEMAIPVENKSTSYRMEIAEKRVEAIRRRDDLG